MECNIGVHENVLNDFTAHAAYKELIAEYNKYFGCHPIS